jgi:D-3-phosphoglycerate dehydrogenase / 2-oxoglutarate reductase
VSNAQPVVLITAPFAPDVVADLAGECDILFRPPIEHGISLAESDHRDYLGTADVIITEIDLVDVAALEAAPQLSLVVSCRAAPVNVDLDACAERSIAVKTTPARNADVTADFAFGLLLSTIRQISRSEAWMRSGVWTTEDVFYPYREFRGMALRGRTLGIVGGGAIGRRMAERARGFGMERIFFDPFVTQDQLGDLGEVVELDHLMATSDIVTVHAPLMESTIGMIADRHIRLMKPTAFLINAGRAALVVKDALVEALREGRIAGAGMDVYWDEPPARDDELFTLPNLTMTPHVAGASDDVVTEHSRLAAEHLRRWLRER